MYSLHEGADVSVRVGGPESVQQFMFCSCFACVNMYCIVCERSESAKYELEVHEQQIIC